MDEGGTAVITALHLSASDEDTSLDQLLVSLVQPPQFGYIENVLPSPGFEKSNMGVSIGRPAAAPASHDQGADATSSPPASFSYRDVVDGHINYVQSRHQRLEPTADQFKLSVSDGRRVSAPLPFYVLIKATNDEVPEFEAHNITVSRRTWAGPGRSSCRLCGQVQEGAERQLDLSVLQAADLDLPEDPLRFSVIRAPVHGRIVRRSNATRSGVAGPPQPALHFTLQDLQNGRWANGYDASPGTQSARCTCGPQVRAWPTCMTTQTPRGTVSSCA